MQCKSDYNNQNTIFFLHCKNDSRVKLLIYQSWKQFCSKVEGSIWYDMYSINTSFFLRMDCPWGGMLIEKPVVLHRVFLI